jgi:hypothetical protein
MHFTSRYPSDVPESSGLQLRLVFGHCTAATLPGDALWNLVARESERVWLGKRVADGVGDVFNYIPLSQQISRGVIRLSDVCLRTPLGNHGKLVFAH